MLSWRERGIDLGRQVSQRATRHSFALMLFVGLILIQLPLPSLGGVFASDNEARNFLQVLWQVEAGALGLSLAIIVFAFQGFTASGLNRYGGTLRQFAHGSGLFHVFRVGVAGLFVTGLVLAHVGRGAPGEPAAVFATVFSGVGIGCLPWVLARALGAGEREEIRRYRTRTLRDAVRAYVCQDLRVRLAVWALADLCEKEEIVFREAFDRDPGPGEAEVRAEARGVVSDVHLRHLRQLARRLKERGQIRLRVRLGSSVGEETLILILPAGASQKDARRARRVVRVRAGKRPDQQLAAYFDGLHEEALDAIRAMRPVAYGDLADAYLETLVEFPSAWGRYDREFDTRIATDAEFLPTGPMTAIRKHLYEQFEAAASSDDRDVAFTASAIPLWVSRAAIDQHASGLVETMLNLFPEMYSVGSRAGTDTGNLFVQRSWTHLTEFLRFYVRPLLGSQDPEQSSRGMEAASVVWQALNRLMKAAIDVGDLATLRDANSHWDDVLRHWHPTRSAEEALERDRTLLRFGLVWWALRQHPRPLAGWEETVRYLTGYLGSLDQLSQVTGEAIEHEISDRFDWRWWELSELGPGTHSSAIDLEFVRVFLVCALMKVSPDSTPQLTPQRWLGSRRDALASYLDQLTTDDRVSRLVPPAEIGARVERLRQAVNDAVEAQDSAEAQSLREAPLESGFMVRFARDAWSAFEAHRFAGPLLIHAGATEEIETPDPSTPQLVEAWLPKELFVADQQMGGLDFVARDLGEEAARAERDQFTQGLANAEQVEITDASFVYAVRGAIRDWRERPTVILLPMQWRVPGELGLGYPGQVVPPAEWNLGEGPARDFHGIFEGVPVFQEAFDIPDDRVYFVDLSQFAVLERWQVPAARRVQVETFTGEEAERLVPQTAASGERARLVEEIRRQVRARLRPGSRIVIREQTAARCIEIPQDLRM